jgi:hypothetical protein
MSWGQTLSQEIANPLPRGKGLSPLVRGLVARVRGAFAAVGWRHAARTETETIEGHACIVLCELLERYREREVSRGVTQKAVARVLNRARKEIRRKYREMCEQEHIEWSEASEQSSPFFSAGAEQRWGVELLENLVESDVLNPTEYFFLLCKLGGWSAEETGAQVGVPQRTVRAVLDASEKRIGALLQEEEERIEAAEPMKASERVEESQEGGERGRPRLSIPWEVLAPALQQVLG